MESYPIINLWFGGLALIANILIFWVAYKALGQIKILQEQNSLTRETIAIAELRHFEKFIISADELNQLINSLNKSNKFKLDGMEMVDFTLSEGMNLINGFKKGMGEWHKFYSENKIARDSAVKCANALEVISTALRYGTAKLEVIEDVIGSTFCLFIETQAYIYCFYRNDAASLYNNSVWLYKTLKPKVRTRIEQVKLIKLQMDELQA